VTTTGRLHAQGKVRDVYAAGDDALLLVATDRISAFDVVLPTPIPDKGRVLTGLSLHWFERTADLVGNHLLASDRASFPAPFDDEPSLAGRALLVRRADVVPLECVARGYLSGSGWAQYRESGSVCGVPLAPGLEESERLPGPIFTPTTKASEGHDLPLAPEEAVDLVGRGLYERLRELTLGIYERIAGEAAERGVIVADTKFEFGFAGGELLLVDEVGTPDSSRFWPADGYEPGHTQPSFDKQFVRDWLDAGAWDREPPPPDLPGPVVSGTASRYREAFERLTGERFEAYLERTGATDRDPAEDEAALDRLREERA
jgi:phosphoribosylaminoimidazole-succinocarboxamide synthase